MQRKNYFEDVRAPVQRTQTLVPAACIVLGLGLISQKRFRPASNSDVMDSWMFALEAKGASIDNHSRAVKEGLSLDRAATAVFFDFDSSHHKKSWTF